VMNVVNHHLEMSVYRQPPTICKIPIPERERGLLGLLQYRWRLLTCHQGGGCNDASHVALLHSARWGTRPTRSYSLYLTTSSMGRRGLR